MQGQLPILVWVLLQYSQTASGAALISTLGMRDFGHMEIETESALPIQETYDLVRNLATYIISHDIRIADGETVGASSDQRIGVSHRKSFRDGVVGPVLWLDLAGNPATAPRPLN